MTFRRPYVQSDKGNSGFDQNAGGEHMLLLGSLSFVLFFIEDLNDWKLNRKIFRICFPAGIILLSFSVIRMISESRAGFLFSRNGFHPTGRNVLFLLLAAAFLILLIYTLFFSFSSAEAYLEQNTGRKAFTSGVYALCRHPGVLWLSAFFWCLYQAESFRLSGVILFSFWNFLLVLFEDLCVFPAQLTDYDTYKNKTPFLIPTFSSIHAFLSSWQRPAS